MDNGDYIYEWTKYDLSVEQYSYLMKVRYILKATLKKRGSYVMSDECRKRFEYDYRLLQKVLLNRRYQEKERPCLNRIVSKWKYKINYNEQNKHQLLRNRM